MKHIITHPRPILWWLGTRTFVANSTISGISSAYFLLTGNYPLAILILLLWVCSLVTWSEYRHAVN